ncbi:MAG TPA: hypothetical protein VHX38_08340 [Pseudonocardiaceae bacterium]|jgi:Mce-associated membrane protein|nr:hypothetical protein [Pseudonocardiaceae bacterium]
MNSDTEQEATELAAAHLDGEAESPTAPEAESSSDPSAPAAAVGGSRSLRFTNPMVAWLSIAIAVLLLCGLAFGGLWLFANNSDNASQAKVREQVLNAAEQGAINFTSLDYNHIQQSLDNWTNSSTGNLSQQFTEGQTVTAFETLMKQNKVVTSGHVQDATITDLESNSATALVYILVDRNVGGKVQQPEYLPLACSLSLTNNVWKISNIGEPNNPFTGTSSSGSPATGSTAPPPSSGSTPTSKSGQ